MSNRHWKFFGHINQVACRLGPGFKIGPSIVPRFASATLPKSEPMKDTELIHSFAELGRCITELGSRNSRFNLLFRFPRNDYRWGPIYTR